MKLPSSEFKPNSAGVLQSGLFIALCSALAISGWSLFWVGVHYGIPVPIAVVISAGFDGAALAAAGYSITYVRQGLNPAFPRTVVLLEAGASAFLNAQHPILLHDSHAAIALYAIPPVTVVVLLEIYLHMLIGLHRKASPARNPKNSRNPVRILGARALQAGTPPSKAGGKSVSAGRVKKEIEAAEPRVRKPEASFSPKDVRAWALALGRNVPATGPVAKSLVAEYVAAQNGHGHADG